MGDEVSFLCCLSSQSSAPSLQSVESPPDRSEAPFPGNNHSCQVRNRRALCSGQGTKVQGSRGRLGEETCLLPPTLMPLLKLFFLSISICSNGTHPPKWNSNANFMADSSLIFPARSNYSFPGTLKSSGMLMGFSCKQWKPPND